MSVGSPSVLEHDRMSKLVWASRQFKQKLCAHILGELNTLRKYSSTGTSFCSPSSDLPTLYIVRDGHHDPQRLPLRPKLVNSSADGAHSQRSGCWVWSPRRVLLTEQRTPPSSTACATMKKEYTITTWFIIRVSLQHYKSPRILRIQPSSYPCIENVKIEVLQLHLGK
jgi:hypothetical protein